MSAGKDKEQDIRSLDGLLLFDKPQGVTSHDIVDLVREKLGIKKVGHTGTLDPLATGLLILLLGKYTSKQEDFQSLDKVYEGTIRLGVTTDTWDIEGKILRKVEKINLDTSSIRSAIALLDGSITQTVPPYSAVKYKGQTLYRLARKNRTVPIIKRTVRVKWLRWDYRDGIIRFKIRCSKGTYIRSIAYEIGEMLGCGGTLSSLRRVSIGEWKVEEAITIDNFIKMSSDEITRLLRK